MARAVRMTNLFSDAQHWQYIVNALIGFGGTVVAVLTSLTPPFRKFRKYIKDAFAGPARVTRLEQKFEEHQEEVRAGFKAAADNLAINTQLAWAGFKEARFMADNSGKFLMVSQELCELVYLSREECSGIGWTKMICEKDREAVMREWRDCLQSSRQFLFTFCVRRGPSNEKIEVEMKADPWPQGFFMGTLKEVPK